MDAGYHLYAGDGVEKSYRKLFISKTPVADKVIYAVTFDGKLGVTHSGNRAWTSVTFGSCPSLTRSFVNTCLMRDGTPFTDREGYQTTPFTEECDKRDTRLATSRRVCQNQGMNSRISIRSYNHGELFMKGIDYS